MPICPRCGAPQPEGTVYCDKCGAALDKRQPPQPAQRDEPVRCPNCGAVAKPGMAFCVACGAPLPVAPPPPPSQSETGPIICPNCGTKLESGHAFCDMCGFALHRGSAAPPPPRQMLPAQPVPAAPPPPPQPMQPQVPPPPPPAPLPSVQGRFVVRGVNAQLPFPPGRQAVVIGRSDPGSGIFPDIDLNAYGGTKAGVSRKHARVFLQGKQHYLEDLGSTNCTYVNRQKLIPNKPYPLNAGDLVRIGRVDLIFYP